MYQNILFDLDGTLTDPKVGIINSIKYALSKLGITQYDEGKLLDFIGPPLQDSFATIFNMDKEQSDLAISYYREYFKEKGLFENVVYDGIPEVLKALKQEGKELFVATSKPTLFAETILKHFELDSYFTAIVGSNLDGTRILKYEIIDNIIRENSITNLHETIMIGDRKHDIIGAQSAEISSIGVTWGYGSGEELNNIKPNLIINTPDQLLPIMK